MNLGTGQETMIKKLNYNLVIKHKQTILETLSSSDNLNFGKLFPLILNPLIHLLQFIA